MAWQKTESYKPGQKDTYKLSRSKIELFMQCQRCFWLGERQKIKRPSGPPFQINKAVDELMKKEFDGFREKAKPHPLMVENNIKAIPMQHKDLDNWRQNFVGVSTLHKATNLYIFGAIDDVWIDKNGKVIVVDYKATAKAGEVSLDSDWQVAYKRQMEIYQWLLRQNGFDVSDVGYFVYTNGRLDLDGFFDRIEFRTKIIAYTGDDSWVSSTIMDMKKCLEGDIPAVGVAAMGGDCEYCAYAKSRTELTLNAMQAKKSAKKK